MRLIFCRVGKHLLIIRPKKYILDLPLVMSFDLVPHLPRLVAKVALFSMREEKLPISFIIFQLFYLYFILLTTKVNNTRC